MTDMLAIRGYVVHEESVNSRGRVQLVISGPGLDHFKMYQDDAQALAEGRVTPDELHASRARLERSRG